MGLNYWHLRETNNTSELFYSYQPTDIIFICTCTYTPNLELIVTKTRWAHEKKIFTALSIKKNLHLNWQDPDPDLNAKFNFKIQNGEVLDSTPPTQ